MFDDIYKKNLRKNEKFDTQKHSLMRYKRENSIDPILNLEYVCNGLVIPEKILL